MGRGTCHGGRPSFPPPPVLGRSTLGAVDMPIGCALTFCWSRAIEPMQRNRRGKSDVLRRCELLADAMESAKLH
jgi:hypothetical protein